jgi:stalled ribosome rescue protein Dom34
MNNTKSDKKIGLWLDHSKAHFIDIGRGPAIVETAYSDKETNVRIKGEYADGTLLGNNRATNNENHKHNRERMIMDEYYRLLADRLSGYDNILLFGPTSAKDELYNKLSQDKHFAGKAIAVAPAGQLTENQMVASVKKFFLV